MNENLIERIWNDAPEEPPLSHAQLAGALQPRVDRGARILRRYVWSFLLLQMVVLVLGGANISGYRSNAVMLGVHAVVVLAALCLAGFGVRLHGEVHRIERMDEALADAVRRRLAFYGTHAKLWMWLAAFSLVALGFEINTLIDNQDGRYTINHPLIFGGVQIAMLLFLFVSFRLSHEPQLYELRAVLQDLEGQILESTRTVDRNLARWRGWRIVLIVALTALLALGVWMTVA